MDELIKQLQDQLATTTERVATLEQERDSLKVSIQGAKDSGADPEELNLLTGKVDGLEEELTELNQTMQALSEKIGPKKGGGDESRPEGEPEGERTNKPTSTGKPKAGKRNKRWGALGWTE